MIVRFITNIITIITEECPLHLRHPPPQENNKKHSTPWKINMDHNHGGLEDHFPFQMGAL